MAEIDAVIGRKKLTQLIAQTQEVQDGLDEYQLQIAIRAEALLLAHRHSGQAHIDMTHGKIDHYVDLVDPNAISIEFGRAGYIDPKTGDEYDHMDGEFILTRAAHLPTKPGRRATKVRRRRRGWLAG